MKFEDLQFIRVTEPSVFKLIDRSLFEQIKDDPFNIDRIYELAPILVKNPNMMIYGLAENFKVRGVLWANIDVLTDTVKVFVLSVEKEYQFDDAIAKTVEFIKTWGDMKIEFVTTRPKAFEKAGMKRSKKIIMEV